MAKFRKKPVVIEAVPVAIALHNSSKDWGKLPWWLRESYEAGGIVFERDRISITTLEGKMIGEMGDWIIQGVKGELYPCKPDIFDATYEPVTD